MCMYAAVLPDSWWDDGGLESAERNSDKQGCDSSKDEAVIVICV